MTTQETCSVNRSRCEIQRTHYALITLNLITESAKMNHDNDSDTLIDGVAYKLDTPHEKIEIIFWEMIRRGVIDMDGNLNSSEASISGTIRVLKQQSAGAI